MYEINTSDSKRSSGGLQGMQRKRVNTTHIPKTKDEELEDLLLQEGRQAHQKVRASSLSKRGDRTLDPIKKEATPIKEEDIEEEFEEQYSGTNSKTTDGRFMIEEARNYDS